MLSTATITRRQALAGLASGASALTLSGCARTLAATPPLAPEALLEDVAWNLFAHEPDRASSLGLDTGAHAALRSRLEDQSRAGQEAYAATLRADLSRVRATGTSGLAPALRTSFEVVESAYATALDGFALPYGDVAVGSWRNAPYVVIQNVGAYLDLPRFLDSDHPVESEADAEAYLSRLAQAPGQLEGELERMTAATAMGLVPPDFLLEKAIAQLGTTIADAETGGALVESLVRRTTDKGIAGDWGVRAQAIVTGPWLAGLKRQLAELQRQRSLATSDAGLWARPHGEEWYAWGLRASTTTRLSPDEVHAMGLEQVEQIHARMDAILREVGYAQGTVGARMTELATDPRYQFAEGDPGRAEIMAFIEERLAWIQAQMPRAFETIVHPNMEVRRLPPAEEPGAPTAYGGAGSKDGTIPGRMWINLRTTDLHRKYSLPTLVHHEMVPGHIWQGEFSNRLPTIRSVLAFNAFSEGWALYAEQLADELGAYDEHPAWRLGYLQDQAFRAARLVVDTGLHHKRWTRQQGIDFFVRRNGNGVEEATSEVDRYCSWPGQACGYKVGHSTIVGERERAKQALGPRFELRAFDQAVVDGGNVPLDVLERIVDRYVAAAKA